MGKKDNPKTITGVAWYSRDQWELLHQVASDRNNLHDSYEEWRDEFNSSLERLEQIGVKCIKISIDILELIDWCNHHHLPINGKARSQFTAEKVRRLDE